MTDDDRSGTYNPFEDTGDWPFRESTAPSPPPPRRPDEDERQAAGPTLFDREAREPEDSGPSDPSDQSLPEAVAAPIGAEPEPVPEPEPEAVAVEEPELEPQTDGDPGPEPQLEAAPVEVEEELPAPDASPEAEPEEPFASPAEAEAPSEAPDQHAPGDLVVPQGPEVLEGGPNGFRRTVAVVVSRFNAEVTNRMLEGAVDALVDAHVSREAITVVPVPGAFELPLAAVALAKTRRFSCIVALGCVIRGETPHFDFVAGEAASGLQLAAIETGVPVTFGLLTVENQAQAEARVGKGAEAAHAALEMADLFTQLRTRATRPA